MINEKVAIIVPVFNVEKYLYKCLDSLINQTYKTIEIILVDDGSFDSSGKICDELAKKDNRVIVIHKQNKGVAEARISGFNQSKSPYICFVDADDYIMEDFISDAMAIIERYKVDFVQSQYVKIFKEKTHEVRRKVSGYFDKEGIEKLLSTTFLYDKSINKAAISQMIWGSVIKREFVYDSLMAGRGLKWSEDNIALYKLMLSINSMYIMDKFYYCYVQHDGQVSNKYTPELWNQKMELYNRYLVMDKKKQIRNQLKLSTWNFIIKKIIHSQMFKYYNTPNSFSIQLNEISNNKSWIDFFDDFIIGLGFKENIKFLLLKYHFFRLYYYLFKIFAKKK